MAIVRDEEVRYGTRIQPVYEAIKSLFVQVSGLLILRSASTSVALELAAQIGGMKQRLEEAQQDLLTTVPPKRYRYRHAHLVRAADGLGHVLNALLTADETMRGAEDKILERAYRAYKLGSADDLGMRALELTGSCCAMGRKVS